MESFKRRATCICRSHHIGIIKKQGTQAAGCTPKFHSVKPDTFFLVILDINLKSFLFKKKLRGCLITCANHNYLRRWRWPWWTVEDNQQADWGLHWQPWWSSSPIPGLEDQMTSLESFINNMSEITIREMWNTSNDTLIWNNWYCVAGICPGLKVRTYDAHEAIRHYVQLQNR